ncbi:MAG: hypothetical protein IKX36_07485 [Prevotella sp.]|nr:hypothetical protein [Prevotella sp.]
MRRLFTSFALVACTLFLQSYSSPTEVQETVFISEKGEVYHARRDCPSLKITKHKIKAVTKEEAIKKYNRRPCKRCYK